MSQPTEPRHPALTRIMDALPLEAVEATLDTTFYRLAQASRGELVKLSRRLVRDLEGGLLETLAKGQAVRLPTPTLPWAVGFLLADAFLRSLVRRDADGANIAAILTGKPDRATHLPDEPCPPEIGGESPRRHPKTIACSAPRAIAERQARVPDTLLDALENTLGLDAAKAILREAPRVCGLDPTAVAEGTRELAVAVNEGLFVPVIVEGHYAPCLPHDLAPEHLAALVVPIERELREHFDEALAALWAEAFLLRLVQEEEESGGIVRMVLETRTA